jgi:hypothetical protein
MMMEKLVELLAGETEILGENLPQCSFVHHKPHMLPGREPGRRGGKPATNRLSYSTTYVVALSDRNYTNESAALSVTPTQENEHEINLKDYFLKGFNKVCLF